MTKELSFWIVALWLSTLLVCWCSGFVTGYLVFGASS